MQNVLLRSVDSGEDEAVSIDLPHDTAGGSHFEHGGTKWTITDTFGRDVAIANNVRGFGGWIAERRTKAP